MAPLIDRERLARRRESRRGRREELLAVARELLLQVPYGRLTLDALGQRVGLRQGATALFFPSREGLVLEVLELELAEWYELLAAEVDRLGEGELEAEGLAALLAASLEPRRLLARLLGLLPTVAEQDADPLALYRLESFRHRWMVRLGATLERCCAQLSPGAGALVLRRVQLVAAALHGAANPAAMTAVALDTPELVALRVDPAAELASLIRLLVDGAVSGAGEVGR